MRYLCVKLCLLSAAAALITCAHGCADKPDSGDIKAARDSGKISKAPDFTLKSLDGDDVSLSQYEGRENVLLVFGATWCPHCVNEIPELKELHAKYGNKGLEILNIDVQESVQKVGSFARDRSIPYTVLLDTSGSVARLYRVRGIPHQVLIDKKGRVVYEGPKPREGLGSLVEKTLDI